MTIIIKRTASQRVLDILKQIVFEPSLATAGRLSEVLEIPLPTVYRHLETLTEEKFIALSPSGTYVPGVHLRTLMLASLRQEPQITLRRVVLKQLSTELVETVSLSVPNGESLVYFDRFESHWPLQHNVKIGDRLPLIGSASGKLYLSTFERQSAMEVFRKTEHTSRAVNTILTEKDFAAELDRIEARQYSFDNEEWFDGMIGAAVPIYDRNGVLCCCLSTHSLTSRKKIGDLEAKIPVMQASAKLLELILFDGTSMTDG